MAKNITQKLDDDELLLLNSVLDKIERIIEQNGFTKKDGKTIANETCYGTTPPEQLPNPVEGQIYFYIEEVK